MSSESFLCSSPTPSLRFNHCIAFRLYVSLVELKTVLSFISFYIYFILWTVSHLKVRIVCSFFTVSLMVASISKSSMFVERMIE